MRTQAAPSTPNNPLSALFLAGSSEPLGLLLLRSPPRLFLLLVPLALELPLRLQLRLLLRLGPQCPTARFPVPISVPFLAHYHNLVVVVFRVRLRHARKDKIPAKPAPTVFA